MSDHTYVPKGAGENFDYSQDHCFVKLSSNATGGELCVVEDLLKPGFRLGRHHHKVMTETFYILEGEVEFELDGETIVCHPGDTLTVPPNAWHAAECKNGGRMLTIFKDGRFDEFLRRLNSMNQEQFNDAKLMKRLSEEFDIFDE